MKILGVDPGREKTGLALIGENGAIVWRQIIVPSELGAQISLLWNETPFEKIALGDSTASRAAQTQIERVLASFSKPAELQIVDETGSTLEARALYFRAFPPQGLKKWIPLSLQVPNEPIDDFAAAVIALRAR